jgi:AcrR family transcriptional regulator
MAEEALVARKTTTRGRLITTAAELFRRQGYGQTGVNQIIQDAKATSGSFYHFFPSKEDLLLAVVEHIAESFENEVFTPAAQRSSGPIDEIILVLDLYRRQIADGGFAVVSPMAGFSTEVSENHPLVRARLSEIFNSWVDRFEELLSRRSTHLRGGFEPRRLAHLIVSAMEGAVLGARLSQSLAPFDATVAELRVYFDRFEDRTESTAAVSTGHRASSSPQLQPTDWRSW